MGAQGFLSDLVNGFFILLERQLDVGDSVLLTNGPINIAGTVVSVGFEQLRFGMQMVRFTIFLIAILWSSAIFRVEICGF